MNRIKEITKCIGNYRCLADVGCDHGLLIIEAFNSCNLKKAIAIDNKEGPLQQAINNISNYNFKSNVRFSLSSGISDIDDDTDVVVIAGMGGKLISNILDGNIRNVNRFILQPNRDTFDVRKKIQDIGFKIVFEKMVYDSGKYYEIIVSDKTDDVLCYSNDELEFGPYFLNNKSELFIEKWQNEITKLDNIKKETTVHQELNKKIERIRSVICI